MDINNISIHKTNQSEFERVSQKVKAKDTEFQAEKGRDLLGVKGDSRHILFRGNPTTTIQSSPNITRFQLKKVDKTRNQKLIELQKNIIERLFDKIVSLSENDVKIKERLNILERDIKENDLNEAEIFSEKKTYRKALFLYSL